MDRLFAKASAWSCIARGTVVATGLLLLIAPLSTAVGLSFDATPPAVVQISTMALALAAFLFGGFETLLPFSRDAAWMQVAGSGASLAATFAGAWAGAHVGARRPVLRFAPS